MPNREIENKIEELEKKLKLLECRFDTLSWINSPKEIYTDCNLPKPEIHNSKYNNNLLQIHPN